MSTLTRPLSGSQAAVDRADRSLGATTLGGHRVEMPQLFGAPAGTISFAGGLPNLEALPMAELSDRIAALLRSGSATVLQYSTPRAGRRLAAAIAELSALEHMAVDPELIVPTAGSQMGLVAIARVLARPGDVVLCETPAYPGAVAAFASSGAEPIGVRCDAEGLIPESVPEVVQQLRERGRRVQLLYCTPSFQNPSGATMPASRRRRLLEVCARLGLTVIEDNPYGLLGFDGEPTATLKSISPDQVVYLGTFSKVLAPGLRCGWMLPPAHLAPELRAGIEVLSLSPSVLAHTIVAEAHRRLGWQRLLTGFRESYARRAQVMQYCLDVELRAAGVRDDWHWTPPTGGFYLWLHGPAGLDTADLLALASARGVLFVPGRHFSLDAEHRSSLRLCFSHPTPRQIADGIARLVPALASTHVDSAHRFGGPFDPHEEFSA